MNLLEATMKALKGEKLDEVYTKEYIGSFDELYSSSWGAAKEVLDNIYDADKETQLMDYLEDLGPEDNPIGRTELNDFITFQDEDIYNSLGLDENGDSLDESKKQEARNPENDEINSKITKTLNGSTKYKDDLKNAGLETIENEKGKVDIIRNPKRQQDGGYRGINKQNVKNSNPNTDYYNYLTKDKVAPEVTDTGAFEHMNAFRNSDNFEKTIGKKDFNNMYYNTDRNGVSKAIPKRYKTGRKNYNYNPDEFPEKDYHGVASYEPINNQELDDFKYAKSTTSDGGWRKSELDKAKAEYDRAKAEYDKENNKVLDIRDRIAKSKANRKAEARSHKEDNERVAPRTVKNARGNDVKTREMVDVSNPAVGNNSYKNQNGNQYWGTTQSEYASKRNKTGKKNEFGYDVYLAPFKNTGDWTVKTDKMEPATATARYQYQKEQGELLKPDLKRYRDKEKRARNPENKDYWKSAADNIQRNIDDYDKKAKEILDKEKEKIANKKTESTEDVDTKNIEAIKDILKKSGITTERTLDLMSKDVLNDLKRNYTKGCKDEYGNYYGVAITDAIQKKIQQITGKMPKLKIGEDKKVTNKELDAVKWSFGLNNKEAKEYIKNNPDKIDSIVKGYLDNAKKNFYDENKKIKEERFGRNRKVRK